MNAKCTCGRTVEIGMTDTTGHTRPTPDSDLKPAIARWMSGICPGFDRGKDLPPRQTKRLLPLLDRRGVSGTTVFS